MQGRRIVTSVHPPGRQMMTTNMEITVEMDTTIEISCGCYQSADYGKRRVSELNCCGQINTTARMPISQDVSVTVMNEYQF